MALTKVTIKADYTEVLENLRPVGPFIGFLLWFRPWHTLLVPKDWPCEIVQTYRYQELFGLAYKLTMEPFPGFPGN